MLSGCIGNLVRQPAKGPFVAIRIGILLGDVLKVPYLGQSHRNSIAKKIVGYKVGVHPTVR